MDAKFYVPYETARELRLKGYPQSTETWYVETAKGVSTYKKQSAEYESIARPTYHEVLDWLTKKSGYFVQTLHASHMRPAAWYCAIDVGGDMNKYAKGYFITREDALNAAILETLRLYI